MLLLLFSKRKEKYYNFVFSLGKKKADPDFVELPIPNKSEVKLELITLSTDEAQDNTVNNVESGSEDNLQNESPGVQEEDDDDNDWEGCPEVNNIT